MIVICGPAFSRFVISIGSLLFCGLSNPSFTNVFALISDYDLHQDLTAILVRFKLTSLKLTVCLCLTWQSMCSNFCVVERI